jgi:deoxyribonuclease-4
MSIRGGLDKAVLRGRSSGCQVIQLFTRNANRWAATPLSPSEIEAFLHARDETSVRPVASHDSYLINLASPKEEAREKSRLALLEEMKRAAALEIPCVVMHPGSHMGSGEGKGLRRVSQALNRVLDATAQSDVALLLETTAGQGTGLGYRFEHLAEIMAGIEAVERTGVCLDTCHAFAAGYDFRTQGTYSGMMQAFDAVIGLERLKMFHVNDAKGGLGSRIDRHAHLGSGSVGKEGFRLLLNDPRFDGLPFVLETPKGENDRGVDWDLANLAYLKALLEDEKADDRF